jgi:hypothetical protein
LFELFWLFFFLLLLLLLLSLAVGMLLSTLDEESPGSGRRVHVCHLRRRIHVCHVRRRIHACHMSLAVGGGYIDFI